MKSKNTVIFIIAVFVVSSFAGCIGDDDDEDEKEIPSKINAPSWTPGDYWVYVFNTPDQQDIATRMVYAKDDDSQTNHLVGTVDPNDARLHSVLNYNPVLGRVTIDGFRVYENGEPQPIFTFPLKKGSTWTFSFLGIENWEASVISVKKANIPVSGETVIVNIRAEGQNGSVMNYSFDTAAGWINSMSAKNSQGETIVNMTLVNHGTGFSGEVYFVRGQDLFDREYTAPANDVHDTFLDEGHPKYGDFDKLTIYLNIVTGSGSGGSLSLRDHESDTVYQETFTSNTKKNQLDEIPDESGNWTLVTNLEGGDASLRIRIAGALWYSWEV